MKTLDVLLHRRRVGTLSLLGGSQSVFSFDEEYIESTDRPTLSLSFKSSDGTLLTEIRPTHTRVPPFFANLLPEGPLREYLATQAGVHHEREFFLLEALGEDLPGAVTVVPRTERQRPSSPGPAASSDQRDGSDRVLRFSLAGVQLKFSAITSATGGLTIPARGMGGSWIVKLPSSHFREVPENEFSMMELARAVGIDVPSVRLVPMSEVDGLPGKVRQLDGNALAIRRFDRPSSASALHIEDFAQVFSVYPEDKYRKGNYRNIAEVLQAEIGTPAIEEFTRRLVFSALIGNGDMHLKNWSLIYPDARSPRLAPAYDLVSTIPYIASDEAALNLYKAGTKQWNDLNRSGLERLADKAGIRPAVVLETARDTVARFLKEWRSGEHGDHLPGFVAETIAAHYPELRIVQELGE